MLNIFGIKFKIFKNCSTLSQNFNYFPFFLDKNSNQPTHLLKSLKNYLLNI